MKDKKRWLIASVALAIILSGALSAVPATHLGVNPGDMITLQTNTIVDPPSNTIFAFHRIFPGGTVSIGEFVVPSGKFLVITDIDYWSPAAIEGKLQVSSSGNPFYVLAPSTAVRDHFTSGLVVGSKQTLRLIFPSTVDVFPGLYIHGYLAPKQ